MFFKVFMIFTGLETASALNIRSKNTNKTQGNVNFFLANGFEFVYNITALYFNVLGILMANFCIESESLIY